MIITIWVVFFIALVVFAFTVSGKDWQKDQGDLLDSVREIKKSPAETKDLLKIFCEIQKQCMIV